MDGTPDTTGEQARAELRRLRQARDWSLAEMARQVPYSKSYLSKLETGAKRITPEIARCLDEALSTGGALAAFLPVPDSLGAGEDDGEPTESTVCPYPGLAAFGPGQARWFFGREQVTADLVSQLDERLAGGELLAVVAPSGAGKSSLLAAGLIPALAGGALPGSRAWPVLATTPGAHPLAALAARVAEQTGADPAEQAAVVDDPQRLAPFLAGTVLTPGGKQGETSSARVVLIVDQFEETFTECRAEAERQAFIAALDAAARSGVALVVLGVRADFYGPCLAYSALLSALQGPVAVGPMSAEQLRAVITRPAETEGLSLEPGLVELLLRDLGVAQDVDAEAGYDPGALPLLAHALRATWHQRQGQTLTVAGYRRTGGIAQALATTAERTYTQLSPAEQHTARQVLLRLVNISDQGANADTRRRLPRARLVEALPLPGSTEAVDTVLEAFSRARLLTLDTTHVEITHDALLRAWPRLRQWIDTDRAGNLTRQELDHAATAWDRDRRDTAGLYRGSRLEAARTWATSTAQEGDLSPTALAFLAASTAQEHRAAKLRRTVLIVLSTLLVLALIAAGLAVWQQQRVSAAQSLLIARGMVTQADRIRDRDPRLALQLGVAARQFDASPQTHASLPQTLTSTSHFRTLRSHTGAVYGMAFAPDGRTLATASTDRTVILWDLGNGGDRPRQLGQPLAGHTSTVNGVAFSPDGRILATTSADRTVILWDLGNGGDRARQLGQPLAGHTNSVYGVAFSPDGRILATTSADRTVILWDLGNGGDRARQLGQPLAGHTNSVYAVAFSPDGRILATTSADQTVRLWDLSDRDRPHQRGQPLAGHTSTVNRVAFSPDGRTLATTSADRTVILWALGNGGDRARQLGQPLAGHTSTVYGVAFAPDGRTLATASADRTVILWDLGNGGDRARQLGQPLAGHTNSVYAVAFSPDGRILATTSADQTVRLWDLSDRDRPHQRGQPLAGHTSTVNGVAFSPDGRILATTSADRTVILWALGNGGDRARQLGQPLAGHTSTVYGVAFAPDGRTLATASADRTVILWDLGNGGDRPRQLGQPLAGHTGAVYGVAFAPDGRTLATASADRTVILWDLGNGGDRARQLGQPLAGHTNTVYGVAFAPDGRTLATASDDRTVRLWDLSDRDRARQLGQPLAGHTNTVYGVAFAPDGRTLATASDDRTVRLWDLSDRDRARQLGQPLAGHTNTVYGVAFAPDGRTLATASDDRTVRLWDLSDRDRARQLGQPLAGHTDSVFAVAFAPDGRTLATASDDHTVRLWDLSDRDRPHQRGQPLAGHTNSVNGVAFAPDGRTLATASGDQTAILSDLPRLNRSASDEVREACIRTGGPLDKPTWELYAPGVSYQDTCAGR